VLVAELHGPREQRVLDVVEQLAKAGRQAVHQYALLLARVTTGDQHRRLLDVLRADLEAQRHAAKLPFGELPAGTLVALVEGDADAGPPGRV
jgi:hypothetical protein